MNHIFFVEFVIFTYTNYCYLFEYIIFKAHSYMLFCECTHGLIVYEIHGVSVLTS